MTTPIDIIKLALFNSGAIQLQQTIYADDIDNGFALLNNLLSQWQIQRYMVYDLVDMALTSTGAASYTIGPAADFAISGGAIRPDRIDSAFCRTISTGLDNICYPYMARENFNRISLKAATGVPYTYFYDASIGSASQGTISFWPIPVTTIYSLHVNYKAYLGQFATLTDIITLPLPYINGMVWGLAKELRNLYGLEESPSVSKMAAESLLAIVNSIAQLPTAVQPIPSGRGGVYSSLAAPQG
jgi:hypothetical protein